MLCERRSVEPMAAVTLGQSWGAASVATAFRQRVRDYLEMKIRTLLTRRKRRRKTSIG
jgi:hypothetical protein